MVGLAADASRSDEIVVTSFGLLTAYEWDAGIRSVPCAAFLPGEFGEAVPVVGSFTTPDWTALEGETAA